MFSKRNSPLKLILLFLFSVLMTSVSLVFGAPFLRVIKNAYGSLTFWSIVFVFGALVFSFGNISLAILTLSVLLSVGISLELERLSLSLIKNLIISGVSSWLILFTSWVWHLGQIGVNTVDRGAEYLREFLVPLMRSQPNIELDYRALLFQAPSALLILVTLSLAVSLIFERRVRFWFKLKKQIPSKLSYNFINFRARDEVIWIALFSLLFSIIKFESDDWKWLGILGSNLTNFFIVIFFFQGVAILEQFLIHIRAGIFFRAFSYFIFLGQMFLVLSFVGFIDYWVDFRRRILKMSPSGEQKEMK